LDHLLHVLVEEAVPYFIQRHRRQQFGFEGPDLEVQRRIEIENRAQSIARSHISHDKDQEIYLVQSQTKPGVSYRIDLDAYDCTCLSFPLIYFCKHICAVQTHYPEMFKAVPTSGLTINCADSFDRDPDLTSESAEPENCSRAPSKSPVGDLIDALTLLTIRLQKCPLSEVPQPLLDLQDLVNCANQHLDSSDLATLPPKKKIAPNQNSWTETAAVMNVAVKSKRKRNTDPYAGGEQSGKRAKPDARTAPPLLPPPPTLSPTSQQA
ncbi:hypothetical protein FPV67DRAFT_1364408, partial [Lyophyllum atratum]